MASDYANESANRVEDKQVKIEWALVSIVQNDNKPRQYELDDCKVTNQTNWTLLRRFC